ncbi:hypothetical protein Pmani_015797 [Petrolisthes manimaculis]|uniref:Ig-like domain-containing protein n=1 Tax=Petrolisthes manimaculis TaxID=1843537 RepID=A0AAE1U721_9EUCA|nr:hypothetical protein Pmani_015797 [Petrolisthes manimaculis]
MNSEGSKLQRKGGTRNGNMKSPSSRLPSATSSVFPPVSIHPLLQRKSEAALTARRGSSEQPLTMVCVRVGGLTTPQVTDDHFSPPELDDLFLTHTLVLGRGDIDGSSLLDEGMMMEASPQITWGRPNTNTPYFHHHTPTNVTAVVGRRAVLPCKVLNLDKKDVSSI